MKALAAAIAVTLLLAGHSWAETGEEIEKKREIRAKSWGGGQYGSSPLWLVLPLHGNEGVDLEVMQSRVSAMGPCLPIQSTCTTIFVEGEVVDIALTIPVLRMLLGKWSEQMSGRAELPEITEETP